MGAQQRKSPAYQEASVGFESQSRSAVSDKLEAPTPETRSAS